jgi:hypothetical protein
MPKDMNLKVQYMRTESGCLMVFIKKGTKLLADVIVYPDDSIWLEVSKENKAPVNIFPDNALHRVWYKEVCSLCGWESEPHEGVPMGPGGTLNCPACQKAKRNGPWVEGAYGSVDAVQLDWETKKPFNSMQLKEKENKP